MCTCVCTHTGQLQDREHTEEVPTSIEVGLLGHLRKLVSVMSDLDARRVLGEVLQHEMLIAIAHNRNIVVRIAVIRVSVFTLEKHNAEWVAHIHELTSCLYHISS